MEHFIVVPNCRLKEITRTLIQSRGVLGVLLIKNPVCLFLVCSVAVNGSDSQFFGRIGFHLTLELRIIQFCHRHRSDRKNGVETADTLLLLDFFHRSVFSRGNFGDIGQHIKGIRFISPISFLIEVFKDILCHQLDAFWRHECLFTVDIPYIFIVDIRLHIHGFNVVHSEG